MSRGRRAAIARALAMGSIGCGLVFGSPALAQGDGAESQNVTINLIHLLVKQGVITQKAADALLKEAQEEASRAKNRTAQSAGPPPAVQTPPTQGTLRVPYVPEIVKNQIRDDVKKQVLQQARDENWAQPDEVPAWTKRFKLNADFRFRSEADLFSSTNDPQIIDFQSFNANGPTDVNAVTNKAGVPILNTTEDRIGRLSIRARLGLDVAVADGVSVGMRLASGGDNGPVSTTQLLGGGFGKKDFWLDQAYLKLESSHWLALTVGRMPDPFVRSDLVYDPDLNFDGVTVGVATKKPDAKGFNFFVTEGLFPLGYIGGNFPDNSFFKHQDFQKWLWGSQIGFNWKRRSFDWRFATSFYDFIHTQGELSAPCAIYLGDKQCSTDFTRPEFMQKGNTLIPIREIVVDPNNQSGTPLPQYVGTAFKYQLVNATSELSIPMGETDQLMFNVDYVRNIAYAPSVACRYAPFALPITNITPGPGGVLDACDGPPSSRAKIASGPNGFYVSAAFGDPKPRTQWAWNISVGYKYLEPDAVPDGYTDSDFHLGGTNARGYVVSGSLGLFDNTWVTARWLSASEVFGPPLAIDVLQLDLNAGL